MKRMRLRQRNSRPKMLPTTATSVPEMSFRDVDDGGEFWTTSNPRSF
jgi:hypothetical protein